MNSAIKNSATLITDGQCAFCQRAAIKLEKLVPTGWVNLPSNELTETWGLTQADLEKSVWLVDTTNGVTHRYSGAKAIGKVFQMRGGLPAAIGWLAFIPPTSWIAAGCYRVVANNRSFFSKFI